jgi:hypothetical protein
VEGDEEDQDGDQLYGIAMAESGAPFELRSNQCGRAVSSSCMPMPANR